MENPLSNLFGIRKNNPEPIVTQPAQQRNPGETYGSYGKRLCGMVNGNIHALGALITKVYQAERQAQIRDEAKQRELKEQLGKELQSTTEALGQKDAQISNVHAKIDSLKERIERLQEDLIEAKEKDGEENKMAKVKMIIGMIILGILTVYLFIFYSSTFYSAFIMTPQSLMNSDSSDYLAIAMFNTQAIPEAYHIGFGTLLFILSAPTIFLGLGYALHFFMQQNGWEKWLKVVSLLAVTLAFDCILAFKISDLLYEIRVMSEFTELPPFSIDIALKDINSWAVIFCGFIVYVIWGIVFDMTTTAYEDLHSNKKEIKCIQTQIANLKAEKADHSQKLAPLQAEKAAIQEKIESLQRRINGDVLIDNQRIKTALADFFAGWMCIMTALLPEGHSEHEQARVIYNNAVNTYLGHE